MKEGVHLILWLFIGALVVLIVTHASGFATAVNAVGGQITSDASLLAGYTPQATAATGAPGPKQVNMLGSAGFAAMPSLV